jgi:hypothetical protein
VEAVLKIALFACAVVALAADTSAPQNPDAPIVRAVIGLEQSGAVSAASSQKFFFDFFQSYPLPGRKAALWRWWGDVRIASYPQEVTASIAGFSAQFASQWANLPVNRLAQAGEFRTGLERRIAQQGHSSLGAVFYFGAQGFLTRASTTTEIFEIPTPGTPQRAAFDRVFPVSNYPDLALASTRYLGIVPTSADSAVRQYGAGVRLTAGPLPAPAMILASFGTKLASFRKNESVTADFEGFYPLAIGMNSSIYLFGRASLAVRGSSAMPPLALNPASVPVTDPGVAIISVPGKHDLYSIGVGIDAAGILKSLLAH